MHKQLNNWQKTFLKKNQKSGRGLAPLCATGAIVAFLELAYHPHHHAKFHRATTRSVNDNDRQTFRLSGDIVALYFVYYVTSNRSTKKKK